MAPSTLSGNWKILQRSLQNAASPRKPFKRKVAEAEGTNSPRKVVKNKRSSFPSGGSKLVLNAKNLGSNPTTKASKSLTSWAEDNDISAADLARAYNLPSTVSQSMKASVGAVAISDANPSKTEVGKYVAIDCEMVGVGGAMNERNALARVSIVNFHGHLVLDTFVRPKEKVIDWRTWVSGVSPASMKDATTFEEAQQKVSDILQDHILVGHAVQNDLEALLLSHPKRDIRDTSRHPAYRKLSKGKTPGLKKLAQEILGIEIQGGEHSSVEDARACMSLYRKQKDVFETLHAAKYPNHANNRKAKRGNGKKKKKK